MEKKKVNKGFVYFLAFMFLGFLLLASTGVYDGTITGAATSTFGDIGNVMRDALILPFESVIKPFFETAFGDLYYLYSIKILLIIILSILFNFGASLIFKENKKSARWVAIILATLGVVLIPSGALIVLFGQYGGQTGFIGSLIIIFVILAFILGIFIPLLKWKAEGMGNNILRGIFFLSFIFLISWVKFDFIGNIRLGGVGFFDIILSMLTVICIVMFFASLVRAFSGNVVTAGRTVGAGIERGTNRLVETGGIRAQPGRVIEAGRRVLGGNPQVIRAYIMNIQKYGSEKNRNIPKLITNLKDLIRNLPSIENSIRFNSARLLTHSDNIFRDGINSKEDDINVVISETKTLLAKL